MSEIVVRAASDSDLYSIASIHKDQFGDHLLGQYSVSLLMAFYRGFLERSIFLIAENSGNTAGFVLGGEGSSLSAQKKLFLGSNFFWIMRESALRPRVWGLISTRLWGNGLKKSSPVSAYGTRLLSIAVDNAFKGKGVASRLVEEFETGLGATREYGLSVLAENARAVAFYKKMGYTEELRRGRSVYFFKKLPEALKQ